jgi:hypothetical protein
MHPSGQAEVDRAKADGRWEAAYDGAKTATVPDDLTEALTADPAAAEFFETLDRQNRYAIPAQSPRRQEGRDPGAPDREVRSDAGEGREAVPVVTERDRSRVVPWAPGAPAAPAAATRCPH